MDKVTQLPVENCYKVVRIKRKRFYSAISKSDRVQSKYFKGCNNLPCKLAVEYILDLAVYPKIGKLFVFDNITHAHSFLCANHQGGNLEIWACYATDLEEGKYLLYVDDMSLYDLIGFWGGRTGDFFRKLCPRGTMLASSVMLLRKIPDD